MTAEVCVVDTGGAVLVVDAVTVATEAGVMVVVVDSREADFSGDDVAMVTDGEADVVAVTGGVLSVFSAVLGGEEEEVRTLEGAAVEGVVTPSAGGDEAAEAFFASAGVAALVDGVVGGGVQTGLDAEGFSGSTCS